MHRLILIIIISSLYAPVRAQPPRPAGLTASDGTYDSYVLVRWDAQAAVRGYKVFRRANPDHGGFQEISKGWQKSTWLCDYGAQPGVTYYYTLIALEGGEQSEMATFDAGYVATGEIVNDQEQLTATGGLYAEPPRYLLAVGEAQTNAAAYRPGQTVDLSFELSNPYGDEVSSTEIMFLLSRDATYGWGDQVLLPEPKVYADFPARGRLDMRERFELPPGTAPGDYYVLIVVSRKGDLSRVQITPSPITVQ